MLPKEMEKLISAFQILSGVGKKTAERYAIEILEKEYEEAIELSNSIRDLKSKIKNCSICNFISDSKECHICNDITRDNSKMIIVEKDFDLINLEENKFYNGKYFVLKKSIAPMKGIMPSDIDFQKLINAIEKNNSNEIIIATNFDTEGQITAQYIKKIIRERIIDKKIEISRLAEGISFGSNISFVDEKTLKKAFNTRSEF